MELSVEDIGAFAIVTILVDHLDANNARQFQREIQPIVGNNTNLIFDLGHITFIDSSGLGAFLACHRQLNAKGGNLKIYGISKTIRTLFEVVRMHRIIEIYNTKKEAIKSFP